MTVLLVHHPSDGKQPWVSVGFSGFVGVVTGVSEAVGLSQKVDDVTDGQRPPGSYDGENTAYVLRDLLENATSAADGVAIARGPRGDLNQNGSPRRPEPDGPRRGRGVDAT